MCGKKAFTLVSPKHVPTSLGATGGPTTIDLTWANHIAQCLNPTTSTRINNHSSDHQSVIRKIFPLDNTPKHKPKHLSITLRKLVHMSFVTSLRKNLDANPPIPLDLDPNTINQSTTTLTKAIGKVFEFRGKWVITNHNCIKPWWDTKILNPLVKKRNAARRQMLKTGLPESKTLYYQHREVFKRKVWELKKSHWRRFLAEKGPENAYLEYKFTKEQSTK
ncbi:hypothetical protein O181_023579 [Austropuccinia psidii MF-1]|uniref:Uncharacterized protein n=1 Tax=Austropuccinia psidii MF-1 TaxID=1389203 RepID=A0A9Q3GYT4_9BASI|nr:hypothetical protein [Austropuccinia psidii MF-1]